MVTLVSQENVVALVSRTGRDLQRYSKGRRLVVGFVFLSLSPPLPLSYKKMVSGNFVLFLVSFFVAT